MFDRATVLGVAVVLIRLATGPLTLLFITQKLTPEEQGFYYAFISTMAATQLAEAGMGFVTVQSISRLLAVQGTWNCNEVKNRILFALIWFMGVSLFALILVQFIGVQLFEKRETVVVWRGPWLALVVASAIAMWISSLGFVLEGVQRAERTFLIQIFSALVSAVSLWVSIYLGAGLLSVGISVAAGAVIAGPLFMLSLHKQLIEILREIKWRKIPGLLREEFLAVWPLFSRIGTVWVLGYFFWNATPLIAFDILGPVYAGKLGVTIAVFRMGMSIGESFVATKRSSLSHLIGNNKIKEAEAVFLSRHRLSLSLMGAGVAAAGLIYSFVPDRIVGRFLPHADFMLFGLSYFFLLITLNLAVFLRAFGNEPFFKYSIVQSIILPLGSFVILKGTSDPLILASFYFIFCVCSAWAAYKIYRKSQAQIDRSKYDD